MKQPVQEGKNKKTRKREVDAMISLLDDPDEVIFNTVSGSLLDMGSDIIPRLERAWEESMSSLFQERIESIIQKLQFKNVKRDLSSWAVRGGKDLLEGAWHVARYQYPDISFSDLDRQIEEITREVWLELNENLTALEKTRILNHFFYKVHKFNRNSINFYAPQNSYINLVLESKKGNPITLAILYAVIARKLNMNIYGVNLPKIFLLAYTLNPVDENSSEEPVVLFYINPYNKGAVLGKKDIDLYVKEQKLMVRKSFYLPCSNIEIIQRLLLNLIFSYERIAYPDKLEDLKELLKTVKKG